MLARIENSATALVLILTVQVAINRAEAERVGAELEDARSRTAALGRRADSLARATADAEKRLQELLDTAVAPEEPSVTVQPLEPFALSPKDTAHIENCGVTTVYQRIKAGQYRTVRDGARSTKILMQSIRERRAKLQVAEIKPLLSLAQERRRRRAAVKE
jgi:hypothetical protein